MLKSVQCCIKVGWKRGEDTISINGKVVYSIVKLSVKLLNGLKCVGYSPLRTSIPVFTVTVLSMIRYKKDE